MTGEELPPDVIRSFHWRKRPGGARIFGVPAARRKCRDPLQARTEAPSASPRSKTISSELDQTARGGSPFSKRTTSDEYPLRPAGRDGARRGVPTATVTSGFFSLSSPPSAGGLGRSGRVG